MTHLPDMCRDCADEAGTPWPAGVNGIFHGHCDWCGEDGKSLMPYAELNAIELPGVQAHA